jgi:hypothetical protein
MSILKSKLDKLKELAQDDGMWSIITCMRGPDSPSERPDMSEAEHAAAYRARRDRKFKTVEVIRGASVGHVGSARVRYDTFITLPPKSLWDHFDRHCHEAAQALGLEVRIEGDVPEVSTARKIPVPMTVAPPKPALNLDSPIAVPSMSKAYTLASKYKAATPKGPGSLPLKSFGIKMTNNTKWIAPHPVWPKSFYELAGEAIGQNKAFFWQAGAFVADTSGMDMIVVGDAGPKTYRVYLRDLHDSFVCVGTGTLPGGWQFPVYGETECYF